MEPVAKVEDVGSFVQALSEMQGLGMNRPLWFRGHRNANYRLQASALREEKYRLNEVAMLKRFMQDALPRLTHVPTDKWDWPLLAQHHGVPTRFLDWSENALIGLFFACETDDSKLTDMPEPDGDVWVLMPERLNRESGTWDAQHAQDLPFLGVDATLNPYNPLEAIAAQVTLRHVAVIAARSFPRVTSQWGTFTVTNEQVAIEDLQNAPSFVLRITVAGEAKPQIIEELRLLGVEERIVYPDLHRLGSRVKEMFA